MAHFKAITHDLPWKTEENHQKKTLRPVIKSGHTAFERLLRTVLITLRYFVEDANQTNMAYK